VLTKESPERILEKTSAPRPSLQNPKVLPFRRIRSDADKLLLNI